MSKVFLISDPHFGHESMAVKRGFTSAKEQDELIVYNWNKVVSKRDKVFILGDITMEKANYSILRRLNGNKVVVLGNHDKAGHVRELLNYVDSVGGAVKYKGCILTHIPIHESEIDRFRYSIFGHIHENVIYHPKYINVSCEAVNYTPVEFEILIHSHRNKYEN